MNGTNEKEGIFQFHSHNMNKNSNESHSIIVDLIFQLKVLIISKNKGTHDRYQ